MSNRYKGGVLSATPPTTSSSAAPGIWTLEQQMQATAGTGWPFGGPFTYIEDVFSTWLYTGSSSAQTITNGIDLLNKGGLVWLKGRNVGSAYGYGDHELFDSANVGSTRKYLRSDGTDALGINGSIAATPFTASGFNLDAGPEINNNAGDTNVSWTFRKQPKFFDIVTYTGNGTSGRTVAHNLGSVPGCMIVKKTNNTGQWCVYHRGLTTPATDVIFLNLTNAQTADPNVWNSTAPTSTVFSLGSDGSTNPSGAQQVAYCFAPIAGYSAFGSYTGNGSADGPFIYTGFKPAFVLIKRCDTTSGGYWRILDDTRNTSNVVDKELYPNDTSAEGTFAALDFTSNGVKMRNSDPQYNTNNALYLYACFAETPLKFSLAR